MQIKERIEKEIGNIIENAFGITQDVNLQKTNKEFEGVYTYIIFPLAGKLKKKPEEIAEKIGNELISSSNYVDEFNVIKGFLNLSLKNSSWIEWFNSLIDFEIPKTQSSKILVEFSSPNTNKPLHLGHLRNNFLGDSVSNILEAVGNQVTRVSLVNDRGIHISKSMVAYQQFGNNETPESVGMKGDHLVGKYYVEFDKTFKNEVSELVKQGIDEKQAEKEAPILKSAQKMLRDWEEGDTEVIDLWNKMNNWVYSGFDQTYNDLGINFDKTYYESNTYLLGKEAVQEGLEKGVFFKKEDGSVWIDLSEEGLDEKLILRGDGTSVYITQDIGTTDLKFKDFETDKAIWVVGNEQDYHFKVLFAILEKLNKTYAKETYHLSYGMVNLPDGKMKSREGTVVDADMLLDQMIKTAKATTAEKGKIDDFSEEEANNLYRILALGAIKYYLLKVEPQKKMLFDPKESIDFNGNTGPFIQYTYARIKSILRKKNAPGVELLMPLELNDLEKQLIYLLGDFANQLEIASKEYSPSVVANYAYELAKTFNSFYSNYTILNEPDEDLKDFRLTLIAMVATTLKEATRLMGIELPERM